MIDPEKEREDFISIRQLVGLIANATGKTEQQAAAIVSASLARNPKWKSLTLYEWIPSIGRTPVDHNDRFTVSLRLEKWVETGNSKPISEDLNDRPF